MTDQPELPAAGALPRRGLPVRLNQRRSPQPVMPEQLVTALAVVQGYQGQLVDQLAKQNESSALFSGTVRIKGDHWTRTWQVQYRTVAVANLSPAPVTVATGGYQGAAPGLGAGTHVLLPGQTATFAMSGNALTVYGRDADLVDVQVFTAALPPSYGSIPVQGALGAYTYDGTGKLVSETHAGMTTSYSYDGSGNLTGGA